MLDNDKYGFEVPSVSRLLVICPEVNFDFGPKNQNAFYKVHFLASLRHIFYISRNGQDMMAHITWMSLCFKLTN